MSHDLGTSNDVLLTYWFLAKRSLYMQSTQTTLLDDVAEKIIPNSVIKKKSATKHKRKTHYAVFISPFNP